jgi:hypothetical protein
MVQPVAQPTMAEIMGGAIMFNMMVHMFGRRVEQHGIRRQGLGRSKLQPSRGGRPTGAGGQPGDTCTTNAGCGTGYACMNSMCCTPSKVK